MCVLFKKYRTQKENRNFNSAMRSAFTPCKALRLRMTAQRAAILSYKLLNVTTYYAEFLIESLVPRRESNNIPAPTNTPPYPYFLFTRWDFGYICSSPILIKDWHTERRPPLGAFRCVNFFRWQILFKFRTVPSSYISIEHKNDQGNNRRVQVSISYIGMERDSSACRLGLCIKRYQSLI